ncbi:MAG: ABC transporter substrate-binding protein [Ruminococcus sp.]|jgi:iron complex transport system substrate-binding protein|nr:ABC transporter substrate-binding protein [Ruminococcus sp.]
MRKLQYVLLLVLILAVTACEPIGRPKATETAVITTVTEAEASPVTVYSVSFDTAPETIVCLSPAITEIIYELGFEDKLIGVGQYCDYPPEAKADNADCGSAANPDFKAILELSPALLITQSPIANKDLTSLKNAGITYLLIPAVNDLLALDELYANIFILCRGPVPADEEALPDLPGIDDFENDIRNADIDLGRFVYYLSDDLTAAGLDTFPGSYFSNFGDNIGTPGSTTDTADTTDTDDDTTDAQDTAPDTDADATTTAPDTDDDAATTDTDAAPDTIILPDYLSYLADGVLADSPARIIILSPDATSLLERPTDRVRLVIDELRETGSTETAGEAETSPETEPA